MNETSKVINEDEKIVWEGQPQFWPYLLGVIPVMIFGLIWTVASVAFLLVFMSGHAPVWALGLIGLFILIGLYMLVFSPIYTVLVYKNIWYVLTDKRVLLQSGLIARNFDMVDYDKVESSTANVSILDKIFGNNSGSIAIYANRLVVQTTTDSQGRSSSATRNVPFVLSHITDPYGVFELFKKTSFDVKADINYPNALRPKEDKGYQTEYKPNETK